MKGFLKNTLVVAVLAGSQANAQWVEQVSPVKANLTDVAFLGKKMGYVVGTKGTILFTLNGGKKWDQLKSPVDADITSVTVIDSMRVMITSAGIESSAAVYGSKDQGKTWKRTLTDTRTFATTVTANKTLFSTSSNIYLSADLGRNWEKTRPLNSTSIYRKVEFADPQTGIVAGNVSGVLTYSADLIRTTDGGRNWYGLDVFSFPNSNGYSAFSAIHADSVFMFSNFYNRYSPGDSSQLVLMTNFRLRNVLGIYAWKFNAKILVQSFPDRINDCRFFKSGRAYTAGDKGIIYTSANKGKKWTNDYNGKAPIKAIFMIDEQTGYAVGDGGLILKRTAGKINEEAPVSMNIKIYPNPATAQAFIEFNIVKELDFSVNITDVQGNVRIQVPARNFDKGSHKITVPVSNLHKGVYHIVLISAGNVVASKEIMIIH